jgi:hypothetical protein
MFSVVQVLENSGNTVGQCIRYTYVPLQNKGLVRKQILYSIVTGFGMIMEQVGLIKMHSSDTCSNVTV